MWSLMHCTAESYKAMTGLDWPGDEDAKVYEKVFTDGTKRKVITVTCGIPNCWQERVLFMTIEECTMPKDSGHLVFQGLQQQQHLHMGRLQHMWNRSQQASAITGPVAFLPAMPASVTSVQQELRRTVDPVVRISSQAVEVRRAIAPLEDDLMMQTPGKRTGAFSQLDSPPAPSRSPASPFAAAGPEASAEQVLAMDAQPEPAADEAGGLDEEDAQGPVVEETTKKTREVKTMESVAAVRQLYLQQKQLLWQMKTDANVFELTAGGLRPGCLITKLQGAKTQAQKLQNDVNLVGNLELEIA